MINFNKATGPRPSKLAFGEAGKMVRSETGDWIAVAMSMRPKGATQNEIVTALGKPHRNVIKRLLTEGKVKRHVIPSSEKSVRIKLTLKK